MFQRIYLDNHWRVIQDNQIYAIEKITSDYYSSKTIVNAMNLTVEQRRELMERCVHYQRIHMAGIIRERIQSLENSLETSNARLRDYIEYTTHSNREQIDIGHVVYLMNDINDKRTTYLTIQHICNRIFFDVPRENWHLIGIMPDMITPFTPPEVVDIEYLEGRTTHETLYEVMIRVMKIKPNRIITRNLNNMVDICSSFPAPSIEGARSESFDVFVRLLKTIFNRYDSNPCPRRCIQGLKNISQSELILQMNMAGWILLGVHIPDIQTKFTEFVNEVSRIGVLNILGFNINGQIKQTETFAEDDVDPVTLESFKIGDEICVLECSHRLGSETLRDMIQAQLNGSRGNNIYSNIKCPICRHPVGYYTN